MQEEENQPPFYIRHLILRIPYYILAVIIVFTVNPIVKLSARIYGIIWRQVLHYQVKKLTAVAKKTFDEKRYQEAIKLFLQVINKIPIVFRTLYHEEIINSSLSFCRIGF